MTRLRLRGKGLIPTRALLADHKHAATPALDLFHVAGVAETVGHLEDLEIMDAEPAEKVLNDIRQVHRVDPPSVGMDHVRPE